MRAEGVAEPTGVSTVEERAERVAGELRRAFGDVARAVGGPAARPSRLSTLLKLDKSLTSRLARGLRAESPLELLHYFPSPTGLVIFLDAAARFGADRTLCTSARAAVRELQQLLDELPGGRTALDALSSDRIVEVRRRSEHHAQQAVFRGMSSLLGFRCDTITSAFIAAPSSGAPGGVDNIDMSLRKGMRRLRPSAPVAVFSVNAGLLRADADGPRLRPLHAADDPDDPLSFFLPAFCDPGVPPVNVIRQNGHTIFALADEAAMLPRPVNLAFGFAVQGALSAWRTGVELEEGRSYLLHSPCKLLVRDIWIRDDLYPGAQPEVRLEFPDPTGPPKPRTDRNAPRLNILDVAAPVEHLGMGLDRAGARGIPEHERLLAHAFERSGWDPRRFRGYRTRIQYPVPMINFCWWIPLAEKP